METLKDLFERTISQVIKLKLGLDIYEYTIKDRISDFRNFEAELDIENPVKGTEVKFNSDIFYKWRNTFDNDSIVNHEKDMSSMDVTNELSSEPFRYKEMTFVYLFTILEDFGNSITKITNNHFYVTEIEGNAKSWHSKVNIYSKTSGKDLIAGFASSFGLPKTAIEEKFVDLFYGLKQKRNSIAHELKYPDIRKFQTDIQSLMIIICYLYHINDATKSTIKFFPWHDYNEDDIVFED